MHGTHWESHEAATFWRYIASSLDRLVRVAVDLGSPGIHWRPPAPATNSIAVLVIHTLGNAEENILETLCGQAIGRNRDAEFDENSISAQQLQDRWFSLRPRIEAALMQLPASELGREHPHPRRGPLPGRDILIVVARHAAEHLGQAELTRDLCLALRP
jgi:hypothetical protein